MSVEQELQSVRAQVAQATQARARAEAGRDAATAKQLEILADLKREFNVESLPEARALQENLTASVEKLLADIKAALEEVT